MVLVDTSIWIEVFRKPRPLDLAAVVEFEEVVTCLPVVQGFGDERAYRLARDAMLALPMVESPVREDLFIEPVELYRSARRARPTPRSGADCLIAVCTVRHDLEVLHRDRDFDDLSRVLPLRVRSI